MSQNPQTDAEKIHKALSHPLRQRILDVLNEYGTQSPNELAGRLDERLGNVSYHVRILNELDCVELVDTKPRRGAIEHYYRATIRPMLDDDAWAKLPLSVRRKIFGQNLQDIIADVRAAAESDGFDNPDTHVSRTPLLLDQHAVATLNERLAQVLDEAFELHAASASEVVNGTDDKRRPHELIMLRFEPRKPASGSTRPTRARRPTKPKG